MSSGGLVAFEMARQLQLADETVNLLAMLDTAVPAPTREALTPETLLPAMAAELGCSDLLEGVDAPKTLDALVVRGQAAKRLPEGLTLSRAERIAQVFAITAAIHNRYQPVPTMAP